MCVLRRWSAGLDILMCCSMARCFISHHVCPSALRLVQAMDDQPSTMTKPPLARVKKQRFVKGKPYATASPLFLEVLLLQHMIPNRIPLLTLLLYRFFLTFGRFRQLNPLIIVVCALCVCVFCGTDAGGYARRARGLARGGGLREYPTRDGEAWSRDLSSDGCERPQSPHT